MAVNRYLDEIILLSTIQKEQLKIYYNLLVETSKVINLTTITEEKEVYIKHFYDSILAFKDFEIGENLNLLDIGSGAGFPGIVLKICYPALKITLLEPTKKRCDFLNKVIDELGLKDIEVVNDRAEIYIENKREMYDFVTGRAVAALNIMAELSLGFVKNNGYFIAMKGANFEEEVKVSKTAISKMGGIIEQILTHELPENAGCRSIICIKKVKKTPEIYPRIYSKIKKKPL